MGFGGCAMELRAVGATLNGHNGSVDCVRFTQKDDMVFSSDDIGIIKQWDMNRDSQTTYNGHMKSVKTLDFHPRLPLFVSGSNDTTIRLWDMTRGHEALSKYRAHIATVNHVQFSPDGNWIASAGAEGTVLIWDVRMSAQIKEFLDSTSAVSCIQFHPSELLLAAGRTNGTVDIFDLDANKLLRRITLSTGTVKCCLFNEQGDWLFVGTDSGVTVCQWEADREVDFIEATWSQLNSMKLVNNKLICGTVEGPEVEVHSVNLDMIGRVLPVPQQRIGGGGMNALFNGTTATSGGVQSQKAFLYNQQKELGQNRLRLLGGAGGPNSQPTAAIPPNMHHQRPHPHHHNGTTDSDSGSPSSNLSIEMAIEDETLTPARLNQMLDDDSDTIEFAYPANRTNFDLKGADFDDDNRHNSLSVASSSSPSYDDQPASVNDFRINQRNVEFQRGHHEFAVMADQNLDRYEQQFDDYLMSNSNSLFNSGNSDLGYRSDSGGDHGLRDHGTAEDFPVNNAPPPNYAAKPTRAPATSTTSSSSSRMSRQKTSMGFSAQTGKTTQVVRPTVSSSGGRLTQSKRLGSLSVSDLTDSSVMNEKKSGTGLRSQNPGRRVTRSPVGSRVSSSNKENKNTAASKQKSDFKVEFFGKPPTRSRSTFDMRSAGTDRVLPERTESRQRREQIPVHTSRMSRQSLYESNSNSNNYRSEGRGGGGGSMAEEEFNHIASGHHRVYQALCNRHATLKMNKDVAVMQDILLAIRQIARVDSGSLVDILGAVLEKQNAMTLDMATVVLPELYELLQSDKKFHCTRACDTLRVILTNFLPLIKDNSSSWAAHSLGVDVVSEERWKKCAEARKWLLMIRNIPENRHVSNALGQLQNLIVDL